MSKQIRELIITAVLIIVLAVVITGNLKKKKPAKGLIKETTPSSESVSKPIQPPSASVSAGADERRLALQRERANLSWGRDPFKLSKIDKEFQKADLELKGISFGADKKGFAFINNEIVKKGDKVGDYEVVEIEKDKVLLRKAGQSFYLTLPKE